MADEEYTREEIEKKRTFPKKNTIFLVVLAVLQVVVLVFMILYEPPVQDVIDSYTVSVEPFKDGTVDIRYSFVWTPVDKYEDLTWVEIGVPNPNLSVYENSLTDNIEDAYFYNEGGHYVRVDFKEPHKAGETFRFSFKIRQRRMLCDQGGALFYEFVPGWFNSTPVKQYTFRWKKTAGVVSSNAPESDGEWYLWKGEMKCGDYVTMHVNYDSSVFVEPQTVDYLPFKTNNAYDATAEDKEGVIVLCMVIIIGAFVIELTIIDGIVSYNRGRGFIVRYGHHMHTFGRVNPRYSAAARAYRAAHNSSGGGGGGHSCACACACACAGGGRAGCSQKDTYRGAVFGE